MTKKISKDAFEYASRLISAKQFPADYPVEGIVKEFIAAAKLVDNALDDQDDEISKVKELAKSVKAPRQK